MSARSLVSFVAASISAPRASKAFTIDHVPRMGSDHQRCQSAFLRGIWIGTGLQQPFDKGDAGVFARLGKRCHAVIVGGVHIRAGLQQRIRRLKIVPVGGPQKGSGPIRACGVHIHAALLEEGPHRGHVLTGRGFDDSGLGFRGYRTRRPAQSRQLRPPRPAARAHASSITSRASGSRTTVNPYRGP